MNKRIILKVFIKVAFVMISIIIVLLNYITWLSITQMKAVFHSSVNNKCITIISLSNAVGFQEPVKVIVPGIYKKYEIPQNNFLILSDKSISRIIVDWRYEKEGIRFYTDQEVMLSSLEESLGYRHDLWIDKYKKHSSCFSCIEAIPFNFGDFPFNRIILK